MRLRRTIALSSVVIVLVVASAATAVAASSGSPTVRGVPGAPTAVMAVAGKGRASVTWVPPAAGGGAPIERFRVTSHPGSKTCTTSTTSCTVTKLAAGASYTFTVIAINSLGKGPASAPSNMVTPLTVPSAPTIGAATAGNDQATVTWTEPSDDGGSPISGYVVTPSTGMPVTVSGGATTSYVVTRLAGGTAVSFTVRAVNAMGSGAPSTASNSVIPAFVGLNAYELATEYGVNDGCGSDIHTSVNSFFAALPKGAVVRFWAFQAFGTSGTGATRANVLTWGPLDRVFKDAAKHGDRLIPVLANEWGTCDGVDDQPGLQKGDAFFTGFHTNTDEGPLSYWQWVEAIVARYDRSRAVYAWEPINEAQICDVPESQAVTDLTDFYTAVGGEIHALSPGSRVEEGLAGSGQCGTENGDFATVGASPGVDILSYHDYYGATSPIGGDQYNGIAVRIAQAQALGKPIIAGEMGIAAGIGCPESLDRRAADYSTKVAAQAAAGTVGVLLWDWYPDATTSCVYENITAGDPSLSLLSSAG